MACSTRSAKVTSSVACSPHSVWCTSRISRVPSTCWEMVSERMVSSVMTPPALRMTWASPTSSPSIPNSGIRESMQATTATPRAGPHRLAAGEPPRPLLVRLEHPVDLGHAHLLRPPSPSATLARGRVSDRSARMGPCARSRNTRQWSPALLPPLPEEDVPLAAAHGRVLARDVAARGRAARLRQLGDGRLRRPLGRGGGGRRARRSGCPSPRTSRPGAPTSSPWRRAPCSGS